jgi:hypothetical protein
VLYLGGNNNCANIPSDLHAANILFSTTQTEYQDLLLPPKFSPVCWLPGIEADSSAPEYLMVSQRPFGMLHDADGSCLTVKIGDLGGGEHHILTNSRYGSLTAVNMQ